jgi:FkbM family methyltransferase
MRPLSEMLTAIRPTLGVLKTAFFGQFAEDAILFLTMRPRASGFYIDAGAFHPTEGSNTYKLYLKGWRGITIEPAPKASPLFRKLRPNDVHLNCGIADAVSDLVLQQFPDYPTLNTFSTQRATDLQRDGYKCSPAAKIACKPLRDIVQEICPGQHIDLLSIDCESMDLEVLQSLDYERTRPTVILVEDLEGYRARRDGRGTTPIESFMRAAHYRPIAQMVYSFLYLAEDWLELTKRSAAFDPRLIQPPPF